MKARALSLALLLAACGGSPVGAAKRYVGSVTPTSPGLRCTPSAATLNIQNGQVVFAPNEGTWLLVGLANPDGSLTADKSRPGVSQQVWETTLIGTWSPTTVTGVYKTPLCTFDVRLASS